MRKWPSRASLHCQSLLTISSCRGFCTALHANTSKNINLQPQENPLVLQDIDLFENLATSVWVSAANRDNTDFQTFHFQFLSYEVRKIAAASSSLGMLALLWYHFSWYHKKPKPKQKTKYCTWWYQPHTFSPAYLTIHTSEISLSLKQARKFLAFYKSDLKFKCRISIKAICVVS